MTDPRVHLWRVSAKRGKYMIGSGRVIGVRSEVADGRIGIWTEEHVEDNDSRQVQVVHTGDLVPGSSQHLGVCLGNATGYGEWHVYELLTYPEQTMTVYNPQPHCWLCRWLGCR